MTAHTSRDLLLEGLRDLDISVVDGDIDRCLEYLSLIQRWNKVDNLTTVTDTDEMVRTHLLDSLTVHHMLKGPRILDVGSGAGLPGIPLAVFNPDKHFVLLDAAAKRVRFMRQAAVSLGLQNVEVVQQRADAYPCESCFDHVVSRALASLAAFTEATLRYLVPAGSLLAMKGKVSKDELAALPEKITYTVEAVTVPGLQAERHIVEVKSSFS